MGPGDHCRMSNMQVGKYKVFLTVMDWITEAAAAVPQMERAPMRTRGVGTSITRSSTCKSSSGGYAARTASVADSDPPRLSEREEGVGRGARASLERMGVRSGVFVCGNVARRAEQRPGSDQWGG